MNLSPALTRIRNVVTAAYRSGGAGMRAWFAALTPARVRVKLTHFWHDPFTHHQIIALRAIVALVFGILSVFGPLSTVGALIACVGAWWIIDGLASLAYARTRHERHTLWQPFLLQALPSIVLGLISLAWPSMGAPAFLAIVVGWALMMGAVTVNTTLRLHRGRRAEITGLACAGGPVGFALLLMLFPGPGALAATLYVGAFAVFWGVLLYVLSWQLNPARVMLSISAPEAIATASFLTHN